MRSLQSQQGLLLSRSPFNQSNRTDILDLKVRFSGERFSFLELSVPYTALRSRDELSRLVREKKEN